MRRLQILSILVGLLRLVATPSFAGIAWTDGPGNLRGMNLQGLVVPITGEIWLPRQGWGTTAKSGDSSSVTVLSHTSTSGQNRWQATVTAGDVGFTYDETVEEAGDEVKFSILVTSLTDAPAEGLFFFFHLPVKPFAAGTTRLFDGPTETGNVVLPAVLPHNPRILFANADKVTTQDAQGNLQFDIALNRSLPAAVQDDRAWNTSVYSIYIKFHSGTLARGQQASLQFTLSLIGEPDRSAADVLVDATGTGKHFDGWGGNFVYGLECPECDFMLNNVRVAWARTGMSLDLWEPVNDDTSPATTDWNKLRSRITAGSTLEREFRIAGLLAGRRVPLIMSAWHLPRWLHAGPQAEVSRDLWPELFENITSFLLFAKAEYGAEADLFSFNEPDYGVDVRFSPEAHRDFIKGLGQHFAAAGLRTKLLLGDVTNPNVSTSFAYPAAEDPGALEQVGAVSVHSWAWSDYDAWEQGMRAWSDLAAQLKKPFLVTEVGADAGAWHFPWVFETYQYALGDLRNYLALLRSGQPLAALQWEYTCDYGLVDVQASTTVRTPRFHLIRHFSELTPAGAEHLRVTTNAEQVLCAGFRTAGSRGSGYVIHIANLGPGRPVTVRGLPRSMKSLSVVRTSETEAMAVLPQVPVSDGVFELDLAPQSLVTVSGNARRR